MGNCLITKLKGICQNNDLLKIGELKVLVDTEGKDYIVSVVATDCKLVVSEGITVKSATNKEVLPGTEFNAGIYTLNGKGTLSISNKYTIDTFSFATSQNKAFDFSKSDFDSLKYSKSLKNIVIASDSFLFSLDSLTDINIERVNISSKNLVGELSGLISKDGISYIEIASDYVTGSVDMSKSAKSLNYLYSSNNTFTWETERSSDSFIITLPYANMGNYIDAMLINQAKCNASTESYKKIIAAGTRTSASNAAIQALQSKGYTVSVPAATE